MNQMQEEFYQVMTRLKKANQSRAAMSDHHQLPKAEARVWEMDSNGVIISKPLKKVEVENIGIVGEANKEENKSIPSGTDSQVYKCGTHDYETNSITEFNEHVQNHSSKAASVGSINKVKEIAEFLFAKHY